MDNNERGKMRETEHDYVPWMLIYSVVINVILIVAFGIIFWHTFVRGEWNAGYTACRNNLDNVGKLDIAGAGDTTPIHKGRR